MNKEYDYKQNTVLDPFRDGVKRYGDRLCSEKEQTKAGLIYPGIRSRTR
jgi:hypothetical protein